MESRWGVDDCLTAVLGDDFVGEKRPAWLRASDEAHALANFRREYSHNMRAAVGAFAAQYGGGYERVGDDVDWRPGDVVVGKTDLHEFAIAVVSESCLAVVRTPLGSMPVGVREVYGVWRRID